MEMSFTVQITDTAPTIARKVGDFTSSRHRRSANCTSVPLAKAPALFTQNPLLIVKQAQI
ncbi:hypothetical protein TH25_05285 [Thalassospira profundimaris]|uniref:Uncharacterized protein n=1 Tax=Thalassospira profundimaris TaxID=502049 RepID=A0A367XI65_9PROT|nr:hypothetical protein TH25_05285 [Thalassospira profundimaris]